MADITLKRTGYLVRKLIGLLILEPDGLRAGEALARVAENETLSEYELGTFNSGVRRFENIIRWATVDLVKAGWLAKHKGTWSATDAGKEAYEKWTDPEAFYRQAIRLYQEWKRREGGGEPSAPIISSEAVEEDADKSTRITYERAEEQAWSEIEAHVASMDPYEFQDLVASLLKAMGYYKGWVAPPGKDGGLDIVAYPDPLGTRSPRIKVQVKRQQQRVTADGVRSFVALVNEDDAGLFISLGGFTRDAEDYARMQERRKITLIDMERLLDLWIEFYPKIDEKDRERLPLRPIYFLTPKD